MTKIAAVQMKNSNKALWFDANDVDAEKGDCLIVETSRGIEFGTLDQDIFDADDQDLKQLNSELKKVKRKANQDDLFQADEMDQKGRDSFETFVELAAETNPDMLPISIEYLFDGKKAIFYFSAPERQDFRDLVKKLSTKLHVRVDMRQINERDKSSMVGGIGLCGQELCCKRLGKCPKHISIKQAKVQGLALNPENISGMCGKLLCCLTYEFEQYKDFSDRAPKIKGKVLTPDGVASVVEINMPKEYVVVKVDESEKRVKIPLEGMVIDKKFTKDNGGNNQNIRPNKIEKEAWDKAQEESMSVVNLESVYTSTELKGSEKLATGVVKTLPGAKKKKSITISGDDKPTHKQRRRNNKFRSKKHKNPNRNNDIKNVYESDRTTTTRRRSRKIGSGDVRPGQNSSGVKS